MKAPKEENTPRPLNTEKRKGRT